MVCVGWGIYVKLFSRGLLWATIAQSFILTDKKSVTFVIDQWEISLSLVKAKGPDQTTFNYWGCKESLTKVMHDQWKLHWVMSLPLSLPALDF